jgi:hypothetical protein
MKTRLLSLITHERLIVRFITSWLIGTLILLAAWFISDTSLPDKFFKFLPGMAISPIECDIGSLSETIKTFAWNLLLTGGFCIATSLFAVGRFPYGYVVPWIIFGVYGGMLGTDSFNCSNPLNSVGIDISILWKRAGFREITGYLLIPAAMANLYMWRQKSFWSTQVARVRHGSEIKISWEIATGLFAAAGLIAWGAIEEVFNFI